LDFKHLCFSHQNEGKTTRQKIQAQSRLSNNRQWCGCSGPRTAAHPNVLQENFGQIFARAGANFFCQISLERLNEYLCKCMQEKINIFKKIFEKFSSNSVNFVFLHKKQKAVTC